MQFNVRFMCSGLWVVKYQAKIEVLIQTCFLFFFFHTYGMSEIVSLHN